MYIKKKLYPLNVNILIKTETNQDIEPSKIKLFIKRNSFEKQKTCAKILK